jgi:hypothetical protein
MKIRPVQRDDYFKLAQIAVALADLDSEWMAALALNGQPPEDVAEVRSTMSALFRGLLREVGVGHLLEGPAKAREEMTKELARTLIAAIREMQQAGRVE